MATVSHVAASQQEQVQQLQLQPQLPEKLVLQCVPLDDAAAQAVYDSGGNPMLEVSCRHASHQLDAAHKLIAPLLHPG